VKCYFCEFGGFRGGVIENSGLLGCDAASLGEWFSKFQRIIVPSSSASSSLYVPLDPWGWSQYDPSKHRKSLNQQCNITFQKTRILKCHFCLDLQQSLLPRCLSERLGHTVSVLWFIHLQQKRNVTLN